MICTVVNIAREKTEITDTDKKQNRKKLESK